MPESYKKHRNRSGRLIACLLVIWGCNAPRENPFDPDADNYYDGIITQITVHHQYPPFNPISNLELIAPDLQLYGVTDSSGSVYWQHEAVDTLQISICSAYYFSKSYSFQPRASHNSYDIYLNAMPVLEEVELYSDYENIDDQTYVYLKALINDADGSGDIPFVKLMVTDPAFSFSLIRDETNFNLFSTGEALLLRDISSELTPLSLPELNFYLLVKNTNGDSMVSSNYHIGRVIDTNLELITPTQFASLKDSVVFTWPAVQLDYEFSYQISLQQSQKPQKLYGGIPSDQQRYVLKDLTTGQYITQLRIIDNFGNICASELRIFNYVH
jgi:hypothetical protein